MYTSKEVSFSEIIKLVNNTRTTQIVDLPTESSDGRWAIFSGWSRVRRKQYGFHVLYLYANITKEGFAEARDALREIMTQIQKLSASGLGQHSEKYLVYPPSVANRGYVKAPDERRGGLSFDESWTTKQFIESFIYDELDAYREGLRDLKPEHFVDPHIYISEGSDQKPTSTSLLSTLRAKKDSGGLLGVVLAEPGQGKTYLSQYLVSSLARSKELVPIIVSSSQWENLSVADQKSLWKTIVHSFRHFQASIGWVDGWEVEFIRSTFKADIFRLVFDGFDEYVLRNRDTVQPLEVLRSLTDLARDTESKILITSRTAFWKTNLETPESREFIEEAGIAVREFRLCPFDVDQAKEYFKTRFSDDESRVGEALSIFARLRQAESNQHLVGRGFVLSLIADLVDVDGRVDSQGIAEGLVWLIKALCRRDERRHELPCTADQQVEIFRLFATECAHGESASTALLRLCIEVHCLNLPADDVEACLEKFAVHPLLKKSPREDVWRFSEEQIRIVLLAQHTLSLNSNEVFKFIDGIRMSAGPRQDLVAMIVDMVSSERRGAAVRRISKLIRAMQDSDPSLAEPKTSKARYFCALLSLMAVGRYCHEGSERSDRTDLFLEIGGNREAEVHGLNFTDTIGSFDFRNAKFVGCVFDQVVWYNCLFGHETKFVKCAFRGGAEPVKCEGFEDVKYDGGCTFDKAANRLVEKVLLRDERRRYDSNNLRSDLEVVLSKFAGRGGFGLRTVEEPNLQKGSIGNSRHNKEIISMLRSKVLDEHNLSGTTEKGYHVKPSAQSAVKFFLSNNTFIGPVREVYVELKKRLGLQEN